MFLKQKNIPQLTIEDSPEVEEVEQTGINEGVFVQQISEAFTKMKPLNQSSEVNKSGCYLTPPSKPIVNPFMTPSNKGTPPQTTQSAPKTLYPSTQAELDYINYNPQFNSTLETLVAENAKLGQKMKQIQSTHYLSKELPPAATQMQKAQGAQAAQNVD